MFLGIDVSKNTLDAALISQGSKAKHQVFSNDANRHSARFRGYDYAQHGAYFITVCADHHRPFFGTIENDQMKPNWVAHIVEREWLRMGELRDNVFLDEFVVMPNHFHAILIITTPPVGTQLAASGHASSQTTEQRTQQAASLRLRDVGGATPNNVAPDSLSAIVRGFKSAVSRAVNAERATRNQSPVVVWQKRFHDRVIRNEKELLDTRRYIIENPQNWRKDEYA